MAKTTHGFTLLEVLIGLAIVGIIAVSAIPHMNSFLDKQVLKVHVSRLNTYVDRARNLAAVTECPVSMNLQPGSSTVNININVLNSPFMKGCSAWHSQTNSTSSSTTITATLDNVSLRSEADLNFNAVSGVLNAQNQTLITLEYKDIKAAITYLGVGNGVVRYE